VRDLGVHGEVAAVRTRNLIAVLTCGALAVGGVAYAVHARAGGDSRPVQPAAATVATAAVVRTDLADYWTESGTVGYRRQRTLRGVEAGVLTWLPRPGSVVSRGATLYRVGDRPVALLYGKSPMFRDLTQVGTVGRDVRVLADNLRALGYRIGDQPAPGTRIGVHKGTDGIVVTGSDGVFTASLKEAVKRWQEAEGVRPATGTVALGDVLVLPGAVRVGAAAAQLGDDATGNLMAISDQAKAVSVEIDASRADDLKAGQKVRITLPDSSATGGTISSISSSINSNGQADQDADGPKVQVVVSVDKASAIRNISSADVDVRFTGTVEHNVLAVPVGALLALRGGGYGVQVSGGALTAVKVGLFADGLVQVTGAGITAGTSVVTTS
jgi:peptidoglycan hydrolase-like protein with peptidoglycan-binding domain